MRHQCLDSRPPLPARSPAARAALPQDPNVQRMTQAIAEDPVFMEMAKQMQARLGRQASGSAGGRETGLDPPCRGECGGRGQQMPGARDRLRGKDGRWWR